MTTLRRGIEAINLDKARKRMPSVREVRESLPADMRHLEVVDRQDFICVLFPAGTSAATCQRVRGALQAAGFETE
jgi:hypothetical protein